MLIGLGREKQKMGVDNLADVTQKGKRSMKRARVLLAAKIRTSDGEIDVRLRDLSRKGALIETPHTLRPGEEVVFTRGSTVVPARAAWSAGGRTGLEFLRMIDENEVLIHVTRRPSIQTQQRFRRPRVLSEDLSDQERKLAQVWGLAVGISVGD